MEHSQILSWMLAHDWAMRINSLEALHGVAAGSIDLKEIDKSIFHVAQDKQSYRTFLPSEGTALNGSVNGTVFGSTAVIPLVGPIFPRANMMTEMSGAVSASQFISDVRAAVEDPSITSIILNMDSPGGAITGIAEAANYIYAARQTKPICAYVFGQAASAAYWIASAASEIVLFTTSMVGSIGVVSSFTDASAKEEKTGIRQVEIVSTQSPFKRADVKTEAGKAHIQQSVDALAEVFIGAVAQYRGTSVENVMQNFGQGGMVIGEEAVRLGMADRIATMNDLLDANIESQSSFSTTFIEGDRMDPEKLKAEHPALFAAIMAEGTTAGHKMGFIEGQRAENARIAAIETVKAPGYEKIIADNKFNIEMDKNGISALILDAQAVTLSKVAADYNADGSAAASASAAIDKGAETTASSAEEEEALFANVKQGASHR